MFHEYSFPKRCKFFVAKNLPSGVRGLKNVSQQFGVLIRLLQARIRFLFPTLLVTSLRQFRQ